MKKRVIGILTAVLLIFALCAGCAGTKATERTKALILGAWRYYDAETDARYTYLFLDGGKLEQYVVVHDENGKEIELSMGNMLAMSYEVVAADAIELTGDAFGESVEVERIPLEFIDENTMRLGESVYERYVSE